MFRNPLALIVRAFLIGLPVVLATLSPAAAETTLKDVLERMTPEQRGVYERYRAARRDYSQQLEAYWRVVYERRDGRRRKRRSGTPFVAEDYVHTHPPAYRGPSLRKDIVEMLKVLRKPVETRPIPSVADFLASAKHFYKFVPERTSEPEFKRRYAQEALAAGLRKDQVLRVYALETGGQGTADMQAGINPISGKGRPISTALGYAQLLHANSVNELVKNGDEFVRRLQRMATWRGTPPWRVRALRQKAVVVREMTRAAKKVPNTWSAHMAFAATPRGLGIHALNLDADIGPWLQVIKLASLKTTAEKAGRPRLSGAEIELMNLAGPGTGLEMMTPIGSRMPTANFFSRTGYERNPIVHKRTSLELLRKLDERMDVQLKKPGAVEFARIFDEVMRRQRRR
ncbi:MAG: hypothetical protein AB7E70_15715 [Hyphomicrobiaceae bacterium]